jgi:hypothetical protein
MMAIAELPDEPAFRGNEGFSTSVLSDNDDLSTGLVSIGFDVNFFGTSYSQLYVNNNGNVTFDQALSTFTPDNLLQTSRVIIAPFWADVDTTGIGTVTYGQDVIQGHAAFGVNWTDVGYFNSKTDKANTFQLVIIDRSDIAPGDFDFEFNYVQVLWETGDASQGTNGLGGNSARAGYSNGTDSSFELAGSDIDGAFLDNTASGLVHHLRDSIVSGRYRFEVRNGVIGPTAVDDVASTTSGASVTIDVLANDFSSQGVLVPNSVIIVDQPAHGVVVVDPLTGAITYTPSSLFAGQDHFTYTVMDASGDGFGNVSNVATVTIEVRAVPPEVTPPTEPLPESVELIDVPVISPPPPQVSLLVDAEPTSSIIVSSAAYGTNGYTLPPEQMNFAATSAPQAIDAALANDEVNEAFLLAGFLDFVDPEMLVVDLGDEPPAQVVSDTAKTTPNPGIASVQRGAAESKRVAADTTGASSSAPLDAPAVEAAIDTWSFDATNVQEFAVNHWRWFASTASALLLAGAAWKSRHSWMHAARKMWSR